MNTLDHRTIITSAIAFFVIMSVPFTFFMFPNKKRETLVKTVYVSERLQACEAKGGKYSLIWSNYNNEYHEGCSIVSQDIEEF